MAKGDKPSKDARETLTRLEQRLRDLERELRTGTAVPGVPAGDPATAAEAPEAPVPAGSATATEPAPAQPVPVEVEALVEEARVRADALRESLGSLVAVNDHLRETAGDVISAHSRALAELDEALAAAETEARATRAAELRDEFADVAPAVPPPVQPPWEPAPRRRPRRRRWLTVLLALLLLAAVAAAAYVVRERRRDQGSAAPATPTAPTIAVAVPATLQLGITGAQRFSATAASQAVCAGVATAAIVEGDDPPGCPSAVTVLRITDSAFGLVGPRLRQGRGRRCYSVLANGELAPHRDIEARNAARAAAVTDARERAVDAARGDQLPPVRVARAGQDAAARAAAAWDASHRLVPRAIAPAPGQPCVQPTPAALASGRYPLAHRLSLIARSGSSTSPAVTAAADVLRAVYGGAVPLDAHVLR